MYIVTETFRISRTALLSQALRAMSPAIWGVAAGLLVLGTGLAITVDWRWALVTAMLLLVLVPALLAFLFFNYALSPRCLPQTYPHTVTFGDDGFEVRATVPPLPSRDGEEVTDATPKHIGYNAVYGDVTKVRLGTGGMTITLRGNPPGILHIPLEMLPSGVPVSVILSKCMNK